MCGIFGYISKSCPNTNYSKLLLNNLKHRGPDDDGIVYNKDRTQSIGNTRLSIIDLDNGSQPFSDNLNKIHIVQNGEIYNYIELRCHYEKLGYNFKTNSDTEVILAAYITDGLKFINNLNGMFAIAIMDENRNELILIRDRLGVKPLYYFKTDNSIIFASEVKPLLDCAKKLSINVNSLISYLQLNYVHSKELIYNNFYQIEPSQVCIFNDKLNIKESFYWNLNKISDKNTLDDNINNQLIDNSLKIRLRSDVDICTFLSGGIDSSLLIYKLTKTLCRKVETFTIGFDNPSLDESDIANSLTSELNLKSNIIKFDIDIYKQWNKILSVLDQPHGDTSFLPTKLLCESIAQKYKVVLTGDGADEIFFGYSRFSEYLNSRKKVIFEEYFKNISVFQFKELNFINSFEENENTAFNDFNNIINDTNYKCNLNKLLYLDLKTILPNNNLIKPDRMGMMYGIEARNPYMDYRLAEYNFSYAKTNKRFELKESLKNILRSYDVKSIIPNKKQTFSVPYNNLNKILLCGDTVVKEFHLIYDIVKDIFKYNETINCINRLISESRTRELRNLMGLFIWLKYSRINE